MSTYQCPAGCGSQVPQHMYACKRDWFRLPKEIRNAIWSGYRSGDMGRHGRAMLEAKQWYLDNPEMRNQ